MYTIQNVIVMELLVATNFDENLNTICCRKVTRCWKVRHLVFTEQFRLNAHTILYILYISQILKMLDKLSLQNTTQHSNIICENHWKCAYLNQRALVIQIIFHALSAPIVSSWLKPSPSRERVGLLTSQTRVNVDTHLTVQSVTYFL